MWKSTWSELEPLMSCPHSPDNVKKVKDVEKKPVQQVFIGSCTNGSYTDIARAALVFKGRHVNENVSCVCGIATRQIYKQLLHDGYLDMLVDAGVRLIEIACGPCCGIGQTPATNGISRPHLQPQLQGSQRQCECTALSGQPGNCRRHRRGRYFHHG